MSEVNLVAIFRCSHLKCEPNVRPKCSTAHFGPKKSWGLLAFKLVTNSCAWQQNRTRGIQTCVLLFRLGTYPHHPVEDAVPSRSDESIAMKVDGPAPVCRKPLKQKCQLTRKQSLEGNKVSTVETIFLNLHFV
eukprot:3095417-Amphidinium_carterae.1